MWTWILAAFGFLSVVVGADDCSNAKKLDRKTGPLSDDGLAVSWYYVEKDMELADEAVGYATCGTTYPIWARELPDDGQEKNITTCVVTQNNTCAKEYVIKVKKCGSKYIYYLSPTAQDEAYCFHHDDDHDDDEECEEEEHHGKKFHRCSRNHRKIMVFIGGVAILIVVGSIIGVFVWRRRKRAAMLKHQDQYKQKPQDTDGPVVVTTDGQLPPKKY